MRRFLNLSSGLFAVSLTAAAAAAPASFVVEVPSDARVSQTRHVDSAKSLLMRSAAIPSHVQLSLDRERSLGALRVLRFRQVHKNVPVFGRGAAIAFDVNGVSRLATSKIEQRLPDSVVPVLSPADAANAAAKTSGLDASANNTRLLIWPTEQGGRLAYSVLAPSLLPIPYAPVVIIDAITGQTLTIHNLVQYKNLANVHEFNPISSPNTMEVTLPIDEPHIAPQNDLLVSYNCVDTHTKKTVNYMGMPFTVHVCEMQQNAEADATTGDYTDYVLEDHTSGGDPFAQVSIFYHAAKAFEYFRTFDPTFELEATSKPLFLISNLMLPAGLDSLDLTKMSDPDLPLEPFPNAMSVGWDPAFGEVLSVLWPEITGGTLMLGQGSKVDYSYDGDVVYHEFGHSVVAATIGQMSWWHLDEQGATASPGAMNEALADFFSSSITGDPAAGEYSAQETDDDQIRHLENTTACPSHLVGEVHYDSEFFSAALWAARKALANDADKHAFEEAIFTALTTAASGDVGFEELAEAFVASVAASPLGQSAGDALEAEFTTRGVLPACQRTFVYDGTPISSLADGMYNHFLSAGKSMFAGGSALSFAPATFQIEVPLPAEATSFQASFGQLITSGGISSPLGQGKPFTPAIIVSWDEPLSFDWDSKTSNASDPVDCAKITTTRYGATIDIPDGAQTAYVMLVNKGDQDGYCTAFKFDFEGEVAPDGGVDAGAEAGTDAEPLPDAGAVDAGDTDAGGQPSGPGAADDGSDDDGCGCRTAGGGSSGLGLTALLAMIGVGIARRRRRGTIGS